MNTDIFWKTNSPSAKNKIAYICSLDFVFYIWYVSWELTINAWPRKLLTTPEFVIAWCWITPHSTKSYQIHSGSISKLLSNSTNFSNCVNDGNITSTDYRSMYVSLMTEDSAEVCSEIFKKFVHLTATPLTFLITQLILLHSQKSLK